MRRLEEYGVKPLYLRFLRLFQTKRGFVRIPIRISLSGLDRSMEEQ